MRGYREDAERAFFSLFQHYYDSERDAKRQHDPANYSLARMLPLAALAGNPEGSLKIVHVAGTKGKDRLRIISRACLQLAGSGSVSSPVRIWLRYVNVFRLTIS